MSSPATERAIRSLGQAEAMVVSDPEIMGGTPVIRCTRIPVQLVADMRKQGAQVEEILSGYSSLTRELIELAEIYAQAHPLPHLRGETRLTPGARVIARKSYPLEPERAS